MKSKQELKTEFDEWYFKKYNCYLETDQFEWFYSKLLETVRFNNAQFKRRFNHLKRTLNEYDTLKDRIKFLEGKKSGTIWHQFKKGITDLKGIVKTQKEEIKRLNKLVSKK